MPVVGGIDIHRAQLTFDDLESGEVVRDGGTVPDPDGIITGGHGNETARTVAIRRGETIPEQALQEMFRQIIANNRAGGGAASRRSVPPDDLRERQSTPATPAPAGAAVSTDR